MLPFAVTHFETWCRRNDDAEVVYREVRDERKPKKKGEHAKEEDEKWGRKDVIENAVKKGKCSLLNWLQIAGMSKGEGGGVGRAVKRTEQEPLATKLRQIDVNKRFTFGQQDEPAAYLTLLLCAASNVKRSWKLFRRCL